MIVQLVVSSCTLERSDTHSVKKSVSRTHEKVMCVSGEVSVRISISSAGPDLTSLMYNLIQQVVQPHFSTFCEFDLEYNYTVQLVVRGCISTTTLLEIDK